MCIPIENCMGAPLKMFFSMAHVFMREHRSAAHCTDLCGPVGKYVFGTNDDADRSKVSQQLCHFYCFGQALFVPRGMQGTLIAPI
jgi:hypothetical protein